MGLPDLQMFSNRLRKVWKHQSKWARRQGITCFRIYDADIPEFPVVIDYYQGLVHMAEYKRHHQLSEEEYRLWRSGCRQMVVDVLDLPNEKIFFKEREPQKGNQQYTRLGEKSRELIVQENGLNFIINLTDYIDTGLFLDHRITRQWVREQAMDKRVLNLFAYTGSFTVYAAAGGATSTSTVDLSATYINWARRNLEANGLSSDRHRFHQTDVFEWLRKADGEFFDLIILDPPTFSNSKRMRGVLDVQRDHPYLIRACLDHLAPGGILFFSTNFRKFKPDFPVASDLLVKDLTAASIPPDFRNKKIHYCFSLSKIESS